MIDETFVTAIDNLARKAATPETIDIGGIPYSTRELRAITPPSPRTLRLHSLTGIATYVSDDVDGFDTYMIHVAEHDTVTVYEPLDVVHQTRAALLTAEPIVESFRFGMWLSIEEFIIQMQSRFVPTEAVAAILRLVGNVTDGTVKQFTDDGVTQGVTVRSGVARVEEVAVPPRVTLAPYRTFAEIPQPSSEFVFRLRPGKDGQPPSATLFEADGGAWKVEAIEGISAWLTERLPKTVTVIA